MNKRSGAIAIVAIACAVTSAAAQTTTNGSGAAATSSYVAFTSAANAFPLATSNKPVPLVVSDADFAGVKRAVNDLRDDLERVTGAAPTINGAAARQMVIVGTIGKSPIIDRLVREKKIDGAALTGKWETFVIK